MGPLAILFSMTLVLSFTIVLLATRPSPVSKSARRRLESIQESLRSHHAFGYADDLAAAGRGGPAERLGAFLDRYRFSMQMKVLLVHANSSMSVASVLLSSVGAGTGCGLVSYFLLHIPLVSIAAGAAAAAIPCAVLRIKRSRRLRAFDRALPDAIDLMARSLLAGHSMGSSIELVAEQSPQPLAFEFVQVYQQQRLGLHFREALLQMAQRVPSRDLQFLITAILVQKETGGDLTEILARASHVIRERVRIAGEVRTRTAQGRLTGWILALLPVILLALISVITPDYSTPLFHDSFGQKLLYTGMALIAVGTILIRKIVDVRV